MSVAIKEKAIKPFVVRVEVDPERIVGLFISACEGGSNYWCQGVTPHKPEGAKDGYWAMLEGFHLTEIETDAVEFFVSKKDIERGLQLLPTLAPKAFSSLVEDNTDAEVADVFLQLCAFGEIKYG